MKKIAIVGNPNVGKSILFNKLNNKYSERSKKTYSIVSNYPYTTVEVSRTILELNGQKVEILDTPGINSLAGTSDDELATRDLIIKEKPDVIIQALDSTKLKKSLILTSQLLELDIPLVLVSNFIDEIHQKGIWLDSINLEVMLGVPVVESIAIQNKGLDELVDKVSVILNDSATPDSHYNLEFKTPLQYKNVVENGIENLRKIFPKDPPSKALLLLLLAKDKQVESLIRENYGEDVVSAVSNSMQFKKHDPLKNLPNLIMQDRLVWAENVVDNVIKESKICMSCLSEKFGMLSRHPIWGWPILAVVMYVTYLLVGKLAANVLVGLLEESVFHPLYEITKQHISSPFLSDFLVGDYGILSTGLGNALATTLPILTMFFLILNIMEDSGYFTNLCILVSRFTRKLGLSGQAILPLMLGFGCKTMATLTTNILDSKKERYIAIFLTCFAIPCSPQMGLILGILASYSFTSFLVVFGSLFAAEFLAGIILNKIIKSDCQTDFIMEIPPIRVPKAKDLFTKLYFRMKWFMKEIPPLFMLGAFILFILDRTGGLLYIKVVLEPIIVSVLSLPIETVDAFLLCLAKHEAGAVQLLKLVGDNVLSPTQVVVSLIIITALGPCFANLMAVVKQIGLKQAVVLRVVILFAALLTGGVVNWCYILMDNL